MNMKPSRLWAAALCFALLFVLTTAALAQEVGPYPLHTVTYYLHTDVTDRWIEYHTEQTEYGRLTRGPQYLPIDPAGAYEKVFIGWYEDEAFTTGPVNLLQTPITGDLQLFARFGREEDVPAFEPIAAEITLTSSLPAESAQEGQEEATDKGSAVSAVTLVAEIQGIPENVRYTLQWQNDLTGEMADLPGEYETFITFPATEENMGCAWRLCVLF